MSNYVPSVDMEVKYQDITFWEFLMRDKFILIFSWILTGFNILAHSIPYKILSGLVALFQIIFYLFLYMKKRPKHMVIIYGRARQT